MLTWIVLTGEYPPDCGGVGDYTARLGAALASCGDRVLVCVPARRDGGTLDRITGVDVLELPDRFGPRAREVLARTLDAGAARLLVQYVPNAFGVRGTNLSWCRWLLQRAREQRDDVRVMFHEPYFYFEWNRPDRAVLAVSQRTMAVMLLRAASHVYMSTRSWERYLRPYASSRFTPVTLPIPATLPDASADPAVPAARGAWLDGRASTLVGHFGTYGSHVAPALRWLLPRLLRAH
ncbi:MAG TPA: hypothetical protein VD833_01815, partial [Vicinamibacterales bacterium]|nr:hypothetical protein [Vicinamibacterales bacterium]